VRGDPTLAAPRPADASGGSYPPPAQLADLAAQVRSALGGATLTRVLVDESLYEGERLGPGWRPTYVAQGAVAPVVPLMLDGGRVRPDRLGPARRARTGRGAALGALLSPGAPVPVARGSAPAGAAELGAVSSPTVAELVERMLLRSDNDLPRRWPARSRWRRAGPPPSPGAADACGRCSGRRCRPLGCPRTPSRWSTAAACPGSTGCSRRGQPAARPGRRRRRLGRRRAAASRCSSGLPVGGFFRHPRGPLPRGGPPPCRPPGAAGRRRDPGGVSALAGLLRTADGRLLAFDLTADAVPPGANRQAEAPWTRLAGALGGLRLPLAPPPVTAAGRPRPGVPWRRCRADRPAPSTTTSRSPPRAGSRPPRRR
jgi:D-alanyl-D-alanine carboxypeptidase/D-alanyl-D-alanine-endopeptidase (penicillin-binding protein 4)